MNTKIAFLIGNYYKDKIGGAEIQSLILINYLQDHGYDIIYISYGDKNLIKPEIIDKNFKLYRVKRPLLGRKITNYLNRRSIYRILDIESPDILYQRGDFHYMDLISRYGKKRGIPVVTGMTMERHCYPSKISLNYLLPLSLIERYLKKKYFKNSDIIIAQTKEQRRKLHRYQGLESIVIPNSHPIPEKQEIRSDPPNICWVANIKPIKRPHKFLQICDRLSDLNVKFAMIGRGEDKKLTNMIRDYEKNNDNFKYLGEMSFEETNKIIGRSVALVNTSSSEGFSNTFIQAWMRGTPVYSLSADPDGIITSEGLGKVSDDLDKLTKELRAIIKDDFRRERLSKRVKTFAINNYDVQKIGKIYANLFEKFIKKKLRNNRY